MEESEYRIIKNMGKLIGRCCDHCHSDSFWKAEMFKTNTGRIICDSCRTKLRLWE